MVLGENSRKLHVLNAALTPSIVTFDSEFVPNLMSKTRFYFVASKNKVLWSIRDSMHANAAKSIHWGKQRIYPLKKTYDSSLVLRLRQAYQTAIYPRALE